MNNFDPNRRHGSPLPLDSSDILFFGSGPSDSEDDDGSPASSADGQQSPPRMLQPEPEEDFMQVDVPGDDGPGAPGGGATRRQLKRNWQEANAADSGEGEPEASSEPRKYRRTASPERAPGSPKPAPASAATLVCDVVRDDDLIRLILRHGGSMTGEASGHSVGLRLPARPSLEFRVALFCLRKLSLDRKQPFPGREAFIPTADAEFRLCLKEASTANEAGLLRQLLDTGLPAPAELIVTLLAVAADAGADDATEVLRAVADTPSGACAVTQPASPDSLQGLPSEGWQQQVNDDLSDEALDQALDCLAPGGDRERGMALLFGSPDNRPAGQFRIRPIPHHSRPVKELMIDCGALKLGASAKNGWKLYLYAGDFDRERLKAGLIDLQRQEAGDGEMFTALMFAVQWGDTDIVRALLANGARPSVSSADGSTALHLAAACGSASIVELLICHMSAGNAVLPQAAQPPAQLLATLNALNDDGDSALSMAAGNGHYKVCALLLEAGAAVDAGNGAVGNDPPQNPLNEAARTGNTAICTLLIRHGANVNWQRREACTPLMEAAGSGKLATCKLLVAGNANLNIVNDRGDSPLTMAALNGHLHIVEYLLQQGARPTQAYGAPLVSAAVGGDTDIMSLLMQYGAEPDQQQHYILGQRTALMAACSAGSAAAVSLLLERGVDPNLVITENWPACDCALAASESAEVIALLLRHGLKLHDGPDGGKISVRKLIHAAAKNQIHIVELLLQHGVPADPLVVGLVPSDNPLLALNYSPNQMPDEASKTGDIARLLLAHGVPLHHVDRSGADALVLACRRGNLRLAEILLQHGARIGQSTITGQNALQTAIDKVELGLLVRNGNPDAFYLLAMLLSKMSQQDNALTLRKDALQQAHRPVVRDMLLVSWVWANPQLINPVMQNPMNAELYLSACQALTDYFWSPATPEHKKTLLKQLPLYGFTEPVLELLMPYIDAAPALMPVLAGNKPLSRAPLTRAVLQGIFLNLEAALAMQQTWAPYGNYAVPPLIATTLTRISRESVRFLARGIGMQEADITSNTISSLFEICVQMTPQPWMDSEGLPVVQAFDLDEISNILMQSSIYAPLAERIAAAWAAAWNGTAAAAATRAGAARWGTSGTLPMSSASSASQHLTAQPEAFGPDWTTSLEYLSFLSENIDPFLFADTPEPANVIASQPAVDFHDTPIATEMLAAFQRELHARIDAPGTDILTLPETKLQRPDLANTSTRGIYADLMMQQLHMIAQFIKGGVAPASAQDAAPAGYGQV